MLFYHRATTTEPPRLNAGRRPVAYQKEGPWPPTWVQGPRLCLKKAKKVRLIQVSEGRRGQSLPGEYLTGQECYKRKRQSGAKK